jgi:hypothetical protein
MVQTPQQQYPVIQLPGFSHGLHTAAPIGQIAATEAGLLINMKVLRSGRLESRDAIQKYTNTATTSNATPKTFEEVLIGSTLYELLVDDNDELYYLDVSLNPQSIGTLEGETTMLGYQGYAVLFDGSNIKYLDGVSSIKIVYDDGTGTTGYQFDNATADNDSSIALGNGTNTRLAYKFTSQAWDTGYTIPPTKVTAVLSQTGTPNASAVLIRIRQVSDDAIMASGTLIADASTDLSGTPTEYDYTYTASDITNELDPNTAYYLSIEHSGGDVANHVLLHCEDVASGGFGYRYSGSWVNTGTQNPLMSCKPGMGPKSKFGAVFNNRIWCNDEDSPGQLRGSNVTLFDWSTADGAVTLGVIDEDAQTFPIGAIDSIYGELYIYGQEEQPYLCKLSGTSPTNYSLVLLYQRIWATHRTLVNVLTDLWSTSGDGTDYLTGVEQYGDLRTFSASDPIYDRILDNWDTDTAIGFYYPPDGQYWLIMPGHHRVLVARTKSPVEAPDGSGLRYPWSEYEFYWDVFTRSAYKWTASANGTNEYYLELAAGGDPGFDAQPDAVMLDFVKQNENTPGSLNDHEWGYGDNDTLGYSTVYFADESGDPDTTGIDLRGVLIPSLCSWHNGTCFIGCSDGYIYKLDSSIYKDQDTHRLSPRIRTAYVQMPFRHTNLDQIQHLIYSRGGATLSLNIYTNDLVAEYTDQLTVNLPIADDLTLGEASMQLIDANFSASPEYNPSWEWLNINCRSVMIEITDVVLAGHPLYIEGFLLQHRNLEE